MNHFVEPRDPHSVVPALYGLQPGHQIIYHTGFLAMDKVNPHLSTQVQKDIQFIATVANELLIEGKVHLVQRRYTRDSYQYIAVGRQKRKTNDESPNPLKKPEVASSIHGNHRRTW